MSSLPFGVYNFFFGIDTKVDGRVSPKSLIYDRVYDRVQVKIIPE
jgi:hypothetical protein